MKKLAKEHGVNSFKMFMSYKDTLMLESSELMEALKHVKDLGCIAKVHAENGNIIAENQKRLLAQGLTGPEGHPLAQTEEVEAEAVRRACTLAMQANVPLYICSPSSMAAADIIKEFKEKGLVVFGEPSAASLAVDGSHYFNKCWGQSNPMFIQNRSHYELLHLSFCTSITKYNLLINKAAWGCKNLPTLLLH